jgi:chromosome partitioning protein
MQVFVIASQKGGAGKTTLAVHLAAQAAGDRRVLIMDLDPQGSAMEWANRRGDRAPDVMAAHPATIAKEIERAKADGYEMVILDTAPHADHAALQAARNADLVIVPCRPATFDIAAISATLDLCKLANKQAVVVLNAAPVRSKVVEEAMEAVAEKGGTVSPVIVRQRVAFQHCLIDGRTAAEFEPGGAAAHEIAELLAHLIASKQASPQPKKPVTKKAKVA